MEGEKVVMVEGGRKEKGEGKKECEKGGRDEERGRLEGKKRHRSKEWEEEDEGSGDEREEWNGRWQLTRQGSKAVQRGRNRQLT